MSEHPAGWYPDPRGRHEYRYWDGSVWTDHVADQGQASTDPVDVVGPAAAGGSAATSATSSASAVAASQVELEPEPVAREPEPSVEPAHGRSATAAEPPSGPGGSGLWSGESSAASGAGPQDAPDPSPVPAADEAATSSTTQPAPVAAGGPASATPAAAPGDAAGPSSGESPRPVGTSASDALRSATATKSPALAGLLTIVLPGSGHFYLGAGSKAGLAIGLLAATVAAYVIAWFSFTSFLIALVIWVAAAAYGIFDLQGVLKPVREAGAAAASISSQQVGLVLVGAGALLILGLFLPWYHLSVDFEGPRGLGLGGVSQSGSVSGFGSASVIDVVLLIIGIATILLGLAALGVGPLRGQQLPTWLPLVVAAAGAVAVVLVAYRLAIDPVDDGGFGIANVNITVGRGPGLLLDGAAALGIAAAGAMALLQSGRGSKASTNA